MPMDATPSTDEFDVSSLVPGGPPRPLVPRFAAKSHVGLVRQNNEDHYTVARVARHLEILESNLPAGAIAPYRDAEGLVLIVADGMGGMAAGEIASRLAIRTGLDLIHESTHWALKITSQETAELFGRIQTYFRDIDNLLAALAQADARLHGMGTTLIAAYAVQSDLFLGHAGDCRAYLRRGQDFRRLTTDHTLAQRFAEEGKITPEDVATHPRRNVLTNYLGGLPDDAYAETCHVVLTAGDRLLLCSDGLHDLADDRTLSEVLGRYREPNAAAQALIDLALDRGGRDNVTVIVADFELAQGG